MLDKNSTHLLDPVCGQSDYRAQETPLSFLLDGLRRGRRLIALSALAFLAVGLFYVALKPKRYTASSEFLVYVKEILPGADTAIHPARADLASVQNQIEMVKSDNVLTKVVASLTDSKASEDEKERIRKGLPDAASDSAGFDQKAEAAFDEVLETLHRKLKVRQVGTSHMVSIAFTASDPKEAARVVNMVSGFYLDELSRLSDAGSSNTLGIREAYRNLGQSVFLVSKAQPPIRSDGPSAGVIALAMVLFGICVGGAGAILKETSSDTIRTARHVEYALGLNCLGAAPRYGAASALPRMLPPDRLRRLTASVLEAALQDRQVIGVVSAAPQEGATTIAISLASSLAAIGKRVLLVDGVSRDCAVSRWAANTSHIRTLSRYGAESDEFDALVETDIGLDVLTRRPSPDTIGDPIRTAALETALADAETAYDIVIVDLQALAAGPQARAAAAAMDGYLLVVKWDSTESEFVRQALMTAGEARRKFIGAVLNMADDDALGSQRVASSRDPAEMTPA